MPTEAFGEGGHLSSVTRASVGRPYEGSPPRPFSPLNRRRRQVVRQRSAKPPSPVQIRTAPPFFTYRISDLTERPQNRHSLNGPKLDPRHVRECLHISRNHLIRSGLTDRGCRDQLKSLNLRTSADFISEGIRKVLPSTDSPGRIRQFTLARAVCGNAF